MSTKPLTPQQTNVLIAESLGWKDVRLERRVFVSHSGDNRPLIMGTSPQGYKNHIPPNFHGSLDACAQFEAALLSEQMTEYWHHLFDIQREYQRSISAPTVIYMICSTAPQRCLAYLKTKGLIK